MRPIKVLFIPRSDRGLASSRVRIFEFSPYLRQEGIDGRILVNPRKKNFFKQLSFIIKFFWNAPRHDIVVLQKIMSNKLFTRFARLMSKIFVFDIDDAMHELHSSLKDDTWARQRHTKGLPRLQYLLRSADAVFCGNEHLALYASNFNKNIDIIPSCINIDEYKTHSKPDNSKTDSPVVFGWIGHDQNLVDFDPIKDILRDTLQELQGQIVLRIVSSKPLTIPGIEVEFVPWSLDGQYEAMAAFDVGLMPLISDARSLGRCGYKAIQYMGLRLPVIASPVGDAGNVVVHGVTGFHAQDAEQWRDAIIALARSPELRLAMGEAGQRRAEDEYSYQTWAPRIAAIMRRLLSNH